MKTAILLMLLSSCGADAATTHYGLTHGAREVIFTQSPYVNDAIVGAQAAAAIWAFRALSTTHPKLAMVLTVTVSSIRFTAAVHNWQAMRP